MHKDLTADVTPNRIKYMTIKYSIKQLKYHNSNNKVFFIFVDERSLTHFKVSWDLQDPFEVKNKLYKSKQYK